MRFDRRWLAAAALAWAWTLAAADASAQSLGGRTAIDAVAAVASTSDSPDDPWVWLDFATTFRVGERVDAIVRPYARRLPGGDWDALFYQAQIQYQPTEGIRIDAGIITSPIGLGALELRPDLNPVVTYPFYYFGSLPEFDEYSNDVQVLSGGYPLGAMVSWSGVKWDLRGGVIDGTPTRSRKIFGDGPDGALQLVAGGGFTPLTGLRFGAGIASGKYRTEGDDDYFEQPETAGAITDAKALVFNVEAEYAIRYTRLSGEWVRDRFDSSTGAVIARGFYVQAVQTLTPRIFAAGRLTRASAPTYTTAGLTRRNRSALELTAGYRLAPELTLKAGYQVSRAYLARDWNHMAVWSLVWSQRWF